MFAIKAPSRKVPPGTVISAIVMFIGIVLLAYGYYGEITAILYAGLIVILGGALTWIAFMLLQRS